MIIHTNIKNDISELMTKLDFPEGARSELLASLERILEKPELAKRFDALLSIYDASYNCDYPAMVAEAKAIADEASVHEYTAQMLLYLALGKRLHALYLERGIDESIFYASLADLRYKLEECRLIYGIVGSFTNNWFQGFYNLTRFALGRLQFEIRKLNIDATVDGIFIPKDSKVINMHIPRTGGKLDHDEVLASYALAAQFFKNEFDEHIIFNCNSWLIDPWHKEILNPESNMIKFFNDFTMIESGFAPDYSSAWRIFDKMYDGDADKLPADSSLRRAYIKRIKADEPLGYGHGIFIYKS